MALRINDVFATSPGVYFRYLSPGEEPGRAYVIELTSESAHIQDWDLSELEERLDSGMYRKRPLQGLAAAYNKPSKKDTAIRDRRWSLIEDLVKLPAVRRRQGRGKLLVEHGKKVGASDDTLSLCLRLYWQGGQTKDALLSNLWACGTAKLEDAERAKNKQAEASPAKAPRPNGRRNEDGSEPYAFFGEERERIQEEAKKLFLVDKIVTRKRLYRVLMTAFYSYQDKSGNLKILSADCRPSRRQVNYALKAVLSLKEQRIRSTSQAGWDNDSKPITGTVLQHVLGVGHIYEIDSTIVDLWLVARDNRNKIIGKATLYLIVDRFSRLIVGFHLSLDKPSWANAMEAVLSLVTDKPALCARWGAEYDSAVWVAHGVTPAYLATDRGSEYLGHDSDVLADDVGIGVINMPAHMSSLKGTVECTFKLASVALKDHAAGYEPPSNPFKRHGDKCYARDAEMTLDELGAEFIDIFKLHNLSLHPGMELDSELVLDTVRPIPAEVWQADVVRQGGQLRTYDEEYLRHKLLPRKRAVVCQEGIYVNKCFYTCKQAIDDEWFVGGRPRTLVDVTYDRRSVNEIYVHNPSWGPKPCLAVLTPRSLKHKDLSVAEVFAIEKRRVSKKVADEHNMHLEVEHAQRREARAERAHRLTTAAKAIQGGESRTSNSDDVRRAEASERRVTEALTASVDVGFEHSVPPPTVPVRHSARPRPSPAVPVVPQAFDATPDADPAELMRRLMTMAND